MRSTGDNGLAFLSKGETVLTEEFTKQLPNAVKSMDSFVKMYESVMKGLQSPNKEVLDNIQPNNNVNITVSYDKLLNVEGNVDKEALPELKDILKKSYEYTSKQLSKEYAKLGYK